MRELIQAGFIRWVALFLFVAVVDIIVLHIICRERKQLSTSLARVLAAATVTTIAYIGSFTFEDYLVSSVFSSIYFVGVDFILLFMLQFVLLFTDANKPSKSLAVIKCISGIWFLVDAVSLLINPALGHAISYYPISYNGHTIYKYDSHFMYDAHLWLCYALVGVIVFALIVKILRVPGIYRRKYITVLGVFLLDVLLNVAYLVGAEGAVLDISVLFYSVSGVLIYYVAFQYSPNKLLNDTRVFIMEHLGSPIVVFDYEDRVIDINKAGQDLFPALAHGHSEIVRTITPREYFAKRGFDPLNEAKPTFEWRTIREGEEKVYQCETHVLKGKKGETIGKMLMMRDVSYDKDLITGLELTPGLYRYLRNLDISANAPVQMFSANVNGLGMINSALGHDKGNLVMARTVEILENVLGKNVYMAKMEDGTIVAVLLRTTRSEISELAEEAKRAIREETSLGFSFEIEYGISQLDDETADPFDVIHDTAMSMKNRKMLSDSSHESSLINSLTQTLLESDYETEAHVDRTCEASKRIAKALKLTDQETSLLALLCKLHDIGKVGIPKEILTKPSKLNDEEWEIMKTHTEKGYRIAMASPELQPLARLILHHHERWDGKGYPGHLEKEEIPLLSRIISVLDSFDVMTHDRPYHKAITLEAAKRELVRCSGTQFDPTITDIFLNICDDVYRDGQNDE